MISKVTIPPFKYALIALVITWGLFILFEKVSVKNRRQIAFEEQDLFEQKDLLHHFPENKKV